MVTAGVMILTQVVTESHRKERKELINYSWKIVSFCKFSRLSSSFYYPNDGLIKKRIFFGFEKSVKIMRKDCV